MSSRHPRLVFRGSQLAMLNADEWTDNNADAVDITIHFADYERLTETVAPLPTNRELREAGLTTVQAWEVAGLLTRSVTRPVVGGFTSSLGTAVRFGVNAQVKTVEDIGMVMFLDRQRVPTDLIDVIYAIPWRNNHPFIAGYVDEGDEMVVVTDDNDNPKLWFRVLHDDVQIFNNPVDRFTKLREEEEVVAQADSIKLDAAAVGVVAYLNSPTISTLFERAGVTGFSNFGTSPTQRLREKERAVKNINVDDRLRRLYDIIQPVMRGMQDHLIVVQIEGTPGMHGTDFIDESQFVAMYDGGEVETEYEAARPFTDARLWPEVGGRYQPG